MTDEGLYRIGDSTVNGLCPRATSTNCKLSCVVPSRIRVAVRVGIGLSAYPHDGPTCGKCGLSGLDRCALFVCEPGHLDDFPLE